MVERIIEGMSPEEMEVMGKGLTNLLSLFGGFEVMAFAKISQVAHYAPEQIITNEDLAQVMDTSDEWISSRTGIKERHISKNRINRRFSDRGCKAASRESRDFCRGTRFYYSSDYDT